MYKFGGILDDEKIKNSETLLSQVFLDFYFYRRNKFLMFLLDRIIVFV